MPGVLIRRAEPDDYEGIWRIYTEEAAYAGTLQVPFPSKESWRKRVTDVPESDYLLVACDGADIIGNAGLHVAGKSPRRAHAMHVGLSVRADWQGKGVGTSLMKALVDLADGWLNVFRLELTVYVDNERAIALYRKLGFEVEGRHKAYSLRNGTYVDTLSMARLKPKS